jgi:hypothetical protein
MFDNDIISTSVVRFRLVKVDVARLLPRGNLDSSYRKLCKCSSISYLEHFADCSK